jgi:uncharacterized membrane protein YesL
MTTQPSPEQVERSELAEQAEKWGTFILANILWGIFCIPIITIPASTAGLFAFLSGRARGKQVELFAEFFGGMRRYWWKSTLLVVFDLLVGGLVVVNFFIFQRMNSDPVLFLTRSVTVFVGMALLLVNLYAWPLLVLINPSMKGLLENSFRLMFEYPLWSFGVLVAAALPIAVSFLLPRGVLLIGMVSLCVWIINLGTWRVIRPHLSQDVLDTL